MKCSITLTSEDACELIREGLAARGMTVDGDTDTSVRLVPSERGDDFEVRVVNVLVSPGKSAAHPPARAPQHVDLGDLRDAPKEPLPPPKIDRPTSKLKVNPVNVRAHTAELGAEVHKELRDFGIDPENPTSDEIGVGPLRAVLR